MKMSTENPRKSRLLREALGEDRRPPSVTRTCWTIGLIVAAIAVIALTGIAAPDRPEIAWTPPAPRTVITNPAIVGWPAPKVSDSGGQTDNVVDLTF
jgi:hypothetical protein